MMFTPATTPCLPGVNVLHGKELTSPAHNTFHLESNISQNSYGQSQNFKWKYKIINSDYYTILQH